MPLAPTALQFSPLLDWRNCTRCGSERCVSSGVDSAKAGSMAVAVVAARLRGILVDAAACQRQGNELEVLEHLMHVGGILRTFPLPESSPEADMIATAVGQRATLEERKVGDIIGLYVTIWKTKLQATNKV